MPRRSILLFAGACIAIAAALATITVVVVKGRERADAVAEGTATGQPAVGGPFQLVNQDGQAVDQTLLNGKWSLVFFGFTYCPDFCPTTLTALEATRQLLGRGRRQSADRVRLGRSGARHAPGAEGLSVVRRLPARRHRPDRHADSRSPTPPRPTAPISRRSATARTTR